MENINATSNQSNTPYSGEGYLIFNVSTANQALPIENANIHIVGADPQNNDIEYNITTNESGISEKIALKAPPRSLSLTPENPYSFASYTARVSKDGYYTQNFIRLPVFDGITSIQPALLVSQAQFNPSDFDPSNTEDVVETFLPKNKT